MAVVRRLPSGAICHKRLDQGVHKSEVRRCCFDRYRSLVNTRELLESSKVRFMVGKGGVGKTTMTAVFGLAASSLGLKVQLIELEGRSELARCFDFNHALTYEPVRLFAHESGGTVDARSLRSDEALVEWLGEHGFGRLRSRLRRSGALEIIATAVPGIRDVLILGKIKALARDAATDVILVDSPATGHSLSLLASPANLMDAARSGPIRRQAEEVAAMLRDDSRSSVTLVTLAGDLPVTEAIEAAYDLEDRTDVALTNIIVNQFSPRRDLLRSNLNPRDTETLASDVVQSLEMARWFTLARNDEEERQRVRLSRELPLDQIVIHHLDATVIGLDQLIELASEFLAATS